MTWETELAIQNLFLDFVNATLTAGWIILAVLVLRVILNRVPRKYVCLLWLVVLFRLLCPVTVETVLSIVPQPTTITYEDVAYTTPKIETNSTVVNTIADFTVNPVMEEYLAPSPATSINPMQVYLMIATMVWLLGIAGIGLYTVISWVRMGMRLRESIPEAGYYRCANIDSPFVFGLLKPKIYLPYGLDGKEKDYVLLHEQSHIARKDFLLKPLFWVAVMIHWMNPMVWVAWHYFSRDLELACDERAVDRLDANAKSEYSYTLLNLAVAPKRFACPVAFGNNSVKQRIHHVLSYKGLPALVRDIVIVLLVLVMLLLAVNPLQAGPLSDFEPKLIEEYAYGLSSAIISYGVVHVSIDDGTITNSVKAEAFRDWLANVKVQKTPINYKPSFDETGVRIHISAVSDYTELEDGIHITPEGFNITVSKDFSTIYVDGMYDYALKIKDREAFREKIMSYCQEELQNYPDTTFYADLNHDGEDERVIETSSDDWNSGGGQANLAVYKKDGTLLFSDALYYPHSGWDNYFLYEQDGKDYLLEFMPSMYQGYATYSYQLFYFDEKGTKHIYKENNVEFSINPEQYEFDLHVIYPFLTEVNTMLQDAMLLVSVENLELLYSTVDNPKQLTIEYYIDWLNETWTGEANIGTLEEKLHNYQDSIFFDRPRQALTMWLIEKKDFDATHQYLASPELTEIDGKQCVIFDLRWNDNTPIPNKLIDRYAISASDPDDLFAHRDGRTYYLYHPNDEGTWIALENSDDLADFTNLGMNWGQSYMSRDGQARYDMLSLDLKKKIDALDEYESIGQDWMPYWLEDKKALGLGGSSPWVTSVSVGANATPIVIGENEVYYAIEVQYEMRDSGGGEYIYEETVTFGLEGDVWKVIDCMVTVNLLTKEVYEQAEAIAQSIAENTYEHKNEGNSITSAYQGGPELWRLDPLEVASKFADDYLQLTDGYWMEWNEEKNIVLCHTDVEDYTIYLYQPIKERWHPEYNFYAVVAYEYYENDEHGKEVLRSYHVGHNLWASLHIQPAE